MNSKRNCCKGAIFHEWMAAIPEFLSLAERAREGFRAPAKGFMTELKSDLSPPLPEVLPDVKPKGKEKVKEQG